MGIAALLTALLLHAFPPQQRPHVVTHPVWPATGTITSPFGRDGARWHPGIDIGTLRSLAVRDAVPGRVLLVGRPRGYDGYGNVVVVRSGKYVELYGHLAAYRVHVGERLRPGQRIATAGCTGSCTGTHLHFEVRRNGRAVSPFATVLHPLVAPRPRRVLTRARRVALGLLGDPQRFQAQTGQRSTERLIIVGWSQGTSADYFTRLMGSMLDTPMVGLSAGDAAGSEAVTPLDIAQGRADALLLALNQAIAARGSTVYVRPLAEMNGHWNPSSAFNQNGTARNAAHSTRVFRKAFARMYVILHGGPKVPVLLARLGLPPLHGDAPPVAPVQVLWNPQGYGSPDLPGNSAQAYYPGDGYVDVVGDDLYDIGGKAEWPSAEALYKAHPGKPFSFPEWGLWGLDDPSFVAHMAQFLRTHPRTVLANYYSGKAGGIFDLASKPRSRALYRSQIAPLGG
jgi:murein DD-endopeptidase MepM/ murein hydrolase activator NlpD